MSRWLQVNTSLPPGATLAPTGPPCCVPGSQLGSMNSLSVKATLPVFETVIW